MKEDSTAGGLPATVSPQSVAGRRAPLAERGLALVSAMRSEPDLSLSDDDLPQKWDEVFDAADSAAREGRLEEAGNLYRACVRIAQRFPSPDIRLGEGYVRLADVLYEMDARDEARRAYQNALPLLEQILGSHPLIGRTHLRLGHIHSDARFDDDAIAEYREALRVYRAACGDLHESVAAVHSSIGLVCERRGQIDDAEQSYNVAVQIWARLDGCGAYAARMLFHLGGVAEGDGRRSEATVLYERALAALEPLVSASDDDLRTLRYTLARDYKATNRLADAERVYRRELADQETIDADGMGIVTVLSRLAELCWAQGRSTEAEELYERAFLLAETSSRSLDPQIADCCQRLSEQYVERGRLDLAEDSCRRAIKLYRATQDCYPDSRDYHEFSIADCLVGLAGICQKQGRLDEALVHFDEAMTIFGREPELDQEFLADQLMSYGNLLRKVGRHEDAQRVDLRAQGLRHKASEPTVDT